LSGQILSPAGTDTQKTLTERYKSIRKKTEDLVKNLEPEDFVPQPIVDVSPPKWHLGHTTWFFEAMVLRDFMKDYQSFNEQLDFIFNSYYESQGPRINRSNRGNLTRPTVAEVFEYRAFVDKALLGFLESDTDPKALELIELGLHHEQQHQELLLTDLKYILGTNPLYPAIGEVRELDRKDTKVQWWESEGGVVKIGHTQKTFCYDNELPLHRQYVEPFALRNLLVTNKEYIEFINAGGYEDFRYWLMEGWEWCKNLTIKAPLYWIENNSQWMTYTVRGGLININPDEPVTHISYYEADAFARWKGLRLPTEFEWELLSKKYNDLEGQNWVESDAWQPVIDRGNSLFGNCWQWTQSAYLPYPGYKAAAGPTGEYNGKFMINQMVLRGGSCATSISHIRPTYRNFFHADKRWQFTGIRLAKSL
jgi:ergothioneine biosynthesis protein EgtB